MFLVCFVIRFYVACLVFYYYTVFSWARTKNLGVDGVYVFPIHARCSVNPGLHDCGGFFLLVVRAAACVSVRYAQTE